MKKYTVLDRQSIFDIAVQECGSNETAFEIALLNNKSVVDDLVTGEELTLPEQTQKRIAEHFAYNHLTPATALGMEDIGYDGINYMGIEFDFMVNEKEI